MPPFKVLRDSFLGNKKLLSKSKSVGAKNSSTDKMSPRAVCISVLRLLSNAEFPELAEIGM